MRGEWETDSYGELNDVGGNYATMGCGPNREINILDNHGGFKDKRDCKLVVLLHNWMRFPPSLPRDAWG
jgi:hypothetical protein